MNESDLERRWQELIIDHSQFPRSHGTLPSASHECEGENPLCGDRVRLYLRIDDHGQIVDASFEAVGCAISLASASILVECVKGLDTGAAQDLVNVALDRLTGRAGANPGDESDLAALQLIRRFPSRVKCASLSWHALRQGLDGKAGKVSTE